MDRSTGSPRADAEDDYLRVRRHQVVAAISARLRGARTAPVSYQHVVKALGIKGESRLGVRVVPIDRIVGSVDKVRDFDQDFRPATGRGRQRWERMAEAMRRGESFGPVDLYELGDFYFIKDGHHRVSISKALGLTEIEADVTHVDTALPLDGIKTDLNRQHWRRIFLERVPLPADLRDDIQVTDPNDYHRLAEMVEAWSARWMHDHKRYVDPRRMAKNWYDDEFEPASTMIEEAGLRLPNETRADAYLRIACARYEISREHIWDTDVLGAIGRRRVRRRAKR